MKHYVAVIAIICIVAGGTAGYMLKEDVKSFAEDLPPAVDLQGYVPLTLDIDGTTLQLTNNCRQISFDVTADQALSIAKAFNKTSTQRPLPHDIFTDVISNFGIIHFASKIDSYSDGIYYAKMIFKLKNSVLELDSRPSDAVAISLRTGVKVYMNEAILNEHSVKVC